MYEKSVILISMIWDYLTEVIREVILRLVRTTVPGEMGNFFVGQIGGLAVYDRALTKEEMLLFIFKYK